MFQEIQVLHRSEKSQVTLMLDTETGKHVVHKILKGEHPLYQKLQPLKHPFLPEILSVQYTDGNTHVTEQYIEGASLNRISLSERELTRLLLELCQVLEFLHGHGILHRDIKPEHLLLAEDGHLRLIDFDAAREPKADDIQDTRLLGTRGYAPPEQYGFSQTDARADLYAVGATFRQLLGPVARKGRWKHILRKCTALDPKDRYASARQIRRAIYRGRIVRWFIRPLCLCITGAFFAYVALIWSNPSVRVAILSVLGMADTQVWQQDELNLSDLQAAADNGTAPLMYEYSGAYALAAYEVLQAQYPDLLILYSGYMDTQGNMVFGCVESTFLIRYGTYAFKGLHSIVSVSRDDTIQTIPIEQYDQYAPAIISIYLAIQDMPQLDETKPLT